MNWQSIKKQLKKAGFLSLVGVGWFLYSFYQDVQNLKSNQWTEEKDRKIVREEIANAQKDEQIKIMQEYILKHLKY